MNEDFNIHQSFIDFLKKNYLNDINKSDFTYCTNPKLLAEGGLQELPTFIEQSVIDDFSNIATELFKIIKSIPTVIFKSNTRTIYEYYDLKKFGIGLKCFDTVYHSSVDIIDSMVGRGDFIYDESGLKCLEYNVGTNIGGLQSKVLEPYYTNNKIISSFIVEKGLKVYANDTLKIGFMHKIKHTSGFVKSLQGGINMVIFWNTIEGYEFLRKIYLQCLSELNLKGDLFNAQNQDLDIQPDGVYLDDVKIHAIIDQGILIKDNRVYDFIKKRLIVIYNGPLGYILTNKINLALLHDKRFNILFSKDQLSLIKKYIPYTVRIENDNKELIDILLKERSDWVIKKGIGDRGKQVFIGKEQSDDNWNEILSEALKSRFWIAQRFCESIPFQYLKSNGGFSINKVVFGFFIYGDSYGGGLLRLLQKDESLVINVANNASMSYILNAEQN